MELKKYNHYKEPVEYEQPIDRAESHTELKNKEKEIPEINVKNIKKFQKKELTRLPALNKILKDQFEKKILLLIESTISVGEEMKKSNKTLKEVKMYLRHQLLRNSKIKTEDTIISSQVPILNTENNNGAVKIDFGKRKIMKGMNIFCFIQVLFTITTLVLCFSTILLCGLMWMNIKVEFCIYLCLIIFGIFLVFGGLSLFLFFCIKKLFFGLNKKFNSLN